MKEKIGIEKLIELLNEYENTDNWENGYQVEFRESKIISKKFGFIKWLVDNDKIDFEGMSGHGKIISYLTDKKDYKWNDIKEGVVLMLLSISDTPIEDLLLYLK